MLTGDFLAGAWLALFDMSISCVSSGFGLVQVELGLCSGLCAERDKRIWHVHVISTPCTWLLFCLVYHYMTYTDCLHPSPAGVTLFELREAATKPTKGTTAGTTAVASLQRPPAVELSALCVTRQPIFAQASLALGPTAAQALVAVHPNGLMLLMRDSQAEAAAAGVAQQAADALASRGAAGGVRGVAWVLECSMLTQIRVRPTANQVVWSCAFVEL